MAGPRARARQVAHHGQSLLQIDPAARPHYANYICVVRYQIATVAAAPSVRPPAALVERLRHVVAEPALVRQRLRSLAWWRLREVALTAVGYGLNQLARRSGPGFRALRATYRRLCARTARAATSAFTPTHFETLLNRHGMTWQEALVRERRVAALRDASRFVAAPSE